jgi:methylenetetrahydrofolate reductase (NADPH)
MLAMKKLTDVFENKPRTFSFELFPPKTPEGHAKLLHTIELLCNLKPDFISCTYGAGGGSREKTLEIVDHIQKKHHTAGVAHLTCVMHTKDEIKKIVGEMKRLGINNILALRGDPPKEDPNWKPGPNNFKYASELVAFIRQNFDGHWGIGVAGFPEGHVLCPDRGKDAEFLKTKVDAGADFVITQLFFDNKDYFEYVERLRKLGVTKRIIPGILPITDYKALVRFCSLCGASIPQKVHNLFHLIEDNPEKTMAAGIQYAIDQCKELLAGGAPGIHFYALNRVHPVDTILEAIR